MIPSRLGHIFALALATVAAPALGQSLTYQIAQTVGSGTVSGQITTSGRLGALAQSDLLSWDLVLNSGGASTTLTNQNSRTFFEGTSLIGSNQNLSFNFDQSGGVLTFQKSLFSGREYWCLQSSSGPCFQGASIVPQSFNDGTQSVASQSGTVVIGTIGSAPPDGPPPGPTPPGPTPPPFNPGQSLLDSFFRLADARFGQMIDSYMRTQVLLDQNGLINCNTSSGGGYISFGSLDVATNGRIILSESLTMLGGISVGTSGGDTMRVPLSTGGALALRFDPATMGSSRPFAEIGMGGSYKTMRFLRDYDIGAQPFGTESRTNGHDFSAYARAGWVSRISDRDELAVIASIAGLWQTVSAYTEAAGPDNPLAATIPKGTDTVGMVTLGAQYTHLLPEVLGMPVEFNLNGAVQHMFHQESGLSASIVGVNFDPQRPKITYYQLGGRLGLRLARQITVDLFVNSTLAPSRIGSSAHGGIGVRTNF
jgi:hypothetical protein